MQKAEIVPAILRQHKADKKESFPDHVVAQTAMIGKEFGELQAAAIEVKYNPVKDPMRNAMVSDRINAAAVKTAAACIRFLEEFNKQ